MEREPTLKLAAAYTAWGIIHCAAKSFTVTRHLKIPVSANYDDGSFLSLLTSPRSLGCLMSITKTC